MFLPESDPEPAAARDARARALGALADLVEKLTGPEGCPWDAQQTPADIAGYLADETRELAEAVAAGDDAHMAEEWGDVAFLVLFFAHIAEQAVHFSLPEAVQELVDKMIRRHPHVFADGAVDGATDMVRQWQEIKARERELLARDGLLDRVPPQVSALRKAQGLQERAARVGFDWPDVQGVWDKVAEEMAELHAARASGDAQAVQHEIGDVLFALVNLQRHLRLPAEQPLNSAANRFTERFREVERLARERGVDMAAAPLEELDALWDEAKRRVQAAAE